MGTRNRERGNAPRPERLPRAAGPKAGAGLRHTPVRRALRQSQLLDGGAPPPRPSELPFPGRQDRRRAPGRGLCPRPPGRPGRRPAFRTLAGPTVESYITRWLARPVVPTLLGFDPLVQFVHEVDALAA